MNSNTPLAERMNNFQYGLFMNLSDQEFRLPNGIARLIHADEQGNCWLLFHTNLQDSGAFEKQFPARIRLYEKGKDYYIEAGGTAVIQTSPEEWAACPAISYGMAKALRYHGLIVCLKLNQVTVTSTQRNHLLQSFYNWMEQTADWFIGIPSRKRAIGTHVFSS